MSALTRLVGGRWPVLVIGALASNARRRDELLDAVGSGITSGVLTAVLRRRLGGGLVEQSPDAGGHTTYRLTPAGESLTGVLATFADWHRQYQRARHHPN